MTKPLHWTVALENLLIAHVKNKGDNQLGEGLSGDNQLGEGLSGDNQLGEGLSGDNQLGEGLSGDNQLGEGLSGDNQLGEGLSAGGRLISTLAFHCLDCSLVSIADKDHMSHVMRKPTFCICTKTKTQISCTMTACI